MSFKYFLLSLKTYNIIDMKFKGVVIEVSYKSPINKGRSFILQKRDRMNRKSFRVFLNNEMRTDAGIMDFENG